MENKLTQPAAQTKSSPPQILVHAFATDFVGSATGAVEDAHWIRGEASARLASDVRRMRTFIVVDVSSSGIWKREESKSFEGKK
jgi:hypothetical protein